jgi:hypothetical protein
MPDTHPARGTEAISRVHLPRLGAEPENVRALVERHAGENWVRTLALLIFTENWVLPHKACRSTGY